MKYIVHYVSSQYSYALVSANKKEAITDLRKIMNATINSPENIDISRMVYHLLNKPTNNLNGTFPLKDNFNITLEGLKGTIMGEARYKQDVLYYHFELLPLSVLSRLPCPK